MSFNIAIDGPAGAGKSTIAKMAAKKLDFIYVDTGAMYRAMALYFLRREIDAKDEKKIAEACEHINVTIAYQEGEQQVLLNGENVNAFIRTEEVSMMTSNTSKYPAVREKLLYLQRELKIYLTASASERAKRRYLEQKERGVESDLAQIERDIIARDEQDMNREISPLRQADDAVLVDSSDMSIEEVVNCLIDIVEKAK